MRFKTGLFAALAVLVCTGGIRFAAAGPVTGPATLVYSFDNISAGGFSANPEGLAIDKKGNIYVALYYSGEIWKFTPDGTPSVFATLDLGPYAGPNGGAALVGMAIDDDDNLFVCLVTYVPESHGVWKVDHHGHASLFAALPEETNPYAGGYTGYGFPNGLSFDDAGNLFVTDSYLSGIWKITRSGSATFWLQDPMFNYAPNTFNGQTGFYGANGIEFDRGWMYVTSTDQGLIARIRVPKDGAAPRAEVFVQDPSLVGADGLAFDVEHNLYVAVDYQNNLVRISPQGSMTTLATVGNGLDYPASTSFDQRHGDRTTLYYTNFGYNLSPAQPSLMKIDVGLPGRPLP